MGGNAAAGAGEGAAGRGAAGALARAGRGVAARTAGATAGRGAAAGRLAGAGAEVLPFTRKSATTWVSFMACSCRLSAAVVDSSTSAEFC